MTNMEGTGSSRAGSGGLSYLADEFYVYLKTRRRLRRLLSRPAPDLLPRPVPRVIWGLWLQGEENAPPLVRYCLDSWRRMNPDHEVRILDAESAAEVVPLDDVFEHLPPSARANMIRNRLLLHEGGIWADATCLCTQPVDQWLPFLMQAGFFAFHNPGPDRLIANWFLASEPQGEIIREIDRFMSRYWARRSERNRVFRPTYFWYHYLVERHYLTDRRFRDAWNRMPRVNAAGPHSMQRHLTGYLPLEDPGDLTRIPLHKLSWKQEITVEQVEDILGAAQVAAGTDPVT